ncbi:MAG: hypothetical protein AAF316_18200 [Cyanobacteria bacterium P01_A01_bin.80]
MVSPLKITQLQPVSDCSQLLIFGDSQQTVKRQAVELLQLVELLQ